MKRRMPPLNDLRQIHDVGRSPYKHPASPGVARHRSMWRRPVIRVSGHAGETLGGWQRRSGRVAAIRRYARQR
jgi:hypothetical protein